MTLKRYEITFTVIKRIEKKQTVRTELDSDDIDFLSRNHKFTYREIA